MQGYFSLAYLVLFSGFIITSFIILFHIARYSLNRSVAMLAGSLFVVVMLVLLSTNVLLYLQLPWDSLLSNLSVF